MKIKYDNHKVIIHDVSIWSVLATSGFITICIILLLVVLSIFFPQSYMEMTGCGYVP